jgi:hypothetical protein
MSTKLHGIILRSENRARLEEFYTGLGLTFQVHQHGGPVHAECQDIDNAFVLEIYAASRAYPRDALIIRVDSLLASIAIAESSGGALLVAAQEKPTMRFAYISDPDGRPVMLFESKG